MRYQGGKDTRGVLAGVAGKGGASSRSLPRGGKFARKSAGTHGATTHGTATAAARTPAGATATHAGHAHAGRQAAGMAQQPRPQAARPMPSGSAPRRKRHLSPLAVLSTAVAGGVCGLIAVMMLYPDMNERSASAGATNASLTASASALPLPFAPQGEGVAALGGVAPGAGKEDMPAPLLVRFASLSSSSVISDTPMILQASLTFDEPVSGSAEILKTPPPEPVDKTFVLRKGELLAAKLVQLGVSHALAAALVEELERVYPLRKIRDGQKFVVTLEQQPDFSGLEVTYPVYLAFSPRPGRQVVVETDDEGQFIASLKRLPRSQGLQERAIAGADYVHVRGRITSSLYAAARDQGVPKYIISQMLRALSHQVDLQRQIKKGDTFEVLYGKPFSGTSSRRYVLHYAALTLSGRKLAFYRYTTPDGKTAYFDAKGQSARRGLMRTPISGARISSGFGMRRHPVLGYTKMHTGVDFAAPPGTPIHAAGAGVVIHAGWRGGYGRTVMIKHPNGYVTLYAHQSRIARGIRKGVKVRQGQVIGYVGATGRVTGPHLHFEVRIKGRKVNPMRVRTATRQKLKGKALQLFRKRMARIEQLLDNIPVTAQIARK